MNDWTLSRKYRETHERHRKMRRKWLFPLFFGVIAVGSLSLGLFTAFERETLIIVVALAALAMGSLLFLTDRFYHGRRPLEEAVLPALVERLGRERSEAVDLSLRSRRKHRDLNRQGGRRARQKDDTSLFEAKFTQSTGQSRIQLFNGFYLVMALPHETGFRLREKDRPHEKGVSYSRGDDIGRYRFYLDGENDTSLPKTYAEILEGIRAHPPNKRVALSAGEDELHVAIERPPIR